MVLLLGKKGSEDRPFNFQHFLCTTYILIKSTLFYRSSISTPIFLEELFAIFGFFFGMEKVHFN